MFQKKIKVCQIIHSLHIGGAELLLLNICKELQSRFPSTYEFTIVATSESGVLQEQFEKINIPVISLNLYGKRFWICIWRIFKTLIKIHPDIVHTHLLPPDKYGQIAAFFARIKHRISTIHNAESSITNYEKSAISIVKLLSKKQIAVSESVKNNVVNRYYYDPNKIDVIYTAPSHIASAKQPKVLPPQNFIKIINLASLKEAKGQRFLIPAVQEMVKISNKFTLDIVGEAQNEYGREVSAFIFKEKVEAHLCIKGKSTEPALLLPHYDIMISLSLWEGFPLAIIEGMLAGLPLILSDIPSHREIVNGIDDFKFVHHDSPTEIAAAFNRLMTDTNYYSYLSKQVIEKSKHFSVDAMITKYNNFYQSIYSKKK